VPVRPSAGRPALLPGPPSGASRAHTANSSSRDGTTSPISNVCTRKGTRSPDQGGTMRLLRRLRDTSRHLLRHPDTSRHLLRLRLVPRCLVEKEGKARVNPSLCRCLCIRPLDGQRPAYCVCGLLFQLPVVAPEGLGFRGDHAEVAPDAFGALLLPFLELFHDIGLDDEGAAHGDRIG